MPSGPILAPGYYPDIIRDIFASEFEIVELQGHIEDRRVDITWGNNQGSWVSMDDLGKRLRSSGDRSLIELFRASTDNSRLFSRNNLPVRVARDAVSASGFKGYCAVVHEGALYLLPGTPLARLFGHSTDDIRSLGKEFTYMSALSIAASRFGSVVSTWSVDRYFKQLPSAGMSDLIPAADELLTAIQLLGDDASVFDATSWSKREPEQT